MTEHHAEYTEYNSCRPIADQLEEWSRAGKRSGTAFAAMVAEVRRLEQERFALQQAVIPFLFNPVRASPEDKSKVVAL